MTYIPDHSHCKFCGNPTAYGTEYCDDDCKALYDAEEHIEKVKDIKFYGIIGGSLIAIALIGMVILVI